MTGVHVWDKRDRNQRHTLQEFSIGAIDTTVDLAVISVAVDGITDFQNYTTEYNFVNSRQI